MTSTRKFRSPPRVLLAGVFGPYGVDDAYGRKENVMELFHNQVTKAQGVASFRFHHRSYGLYFIAENIDADVTVLDFPSRARFIREIRKDYDVVGISFITPNFSKAREMARLVRRHAPHSVIVLGGHGAAIEGIETLIDCDHVAKGEGIRWMRRFLGQAADAPLTHPVLPSAERERIMGVPLPGTYASLLATGVGCVNGCKFCCTSHFFQRAYTPYLRTGKEVFDTACRIADARGTDEFFVMDENFLKDRGRAMELLDEMERHQRYFRFSIFSSAEAITAFGLDNLVRLGVSFLWLGAESTTMPEGFAKNRGIDIQALVQQLRARGIIVLGSGILCMEHHTQDNIQKDVDFLVGLGADFVQFMLLIPFPTTTLYREMDACGLLRVDLPFEEWHGQKALSWDHPHFPGDAPERWIQRAFRQDYEVNSSSMYRVTQTSFRGYQRLSALSSRDGCLEARRRQLETQARGYSLMLPAIARHAVNATERRRARSLDREMLGALGAPSLGERVKRSVIRACARWWQWRLRWFGDMVQPATILTRYKAPAVRAVVAAEEGAPLSAATTAKSLAACGRLEERPAAARIGVDVPFDREEHAPSAGSASR